MNSLEFLHGIENLFKAIEDGGTPGSELVLSVNGQMGHVILKASDVSAVPLTATINGLTLDRPRELTAELVKALPLSIAEIGEGAVIRLDGATIRDIRRRLEAIEKDGAFVVTVNEQRGPHVTLEVADIRGAASTHDVQEIDGRVTKLSERVDEIAAGGSGGNVELSDYVKKTQKVNGYELKGDIELKASDVKAPSVEDFNALADKVNGMGSGGGSGTDASAMRSRVNLSSDTITYYPNNLNSSGDQGTYTYTSGAFSTVAGVGFPVSYAGTLLVAGYGFNCTQTYTTYKGEVFVRAYTESFGGRWSSWVAMTGSSGGTGGGDVDLSNYVNKDTQINKKRIGDGLTLGVGDIEGAATTDDLKTVADKVQALEEKPEPDLSGLAPKVHAHEDLEQRITELENAPPGEGGSGPTVIYPLKTSGTLNDCTAPGFYSFTPSVNALPWNGMGGSMIVADFGGYASQLAFHPTNNEIKVRSYTSGGWLGWATVGSGGGGNTDLTDYVLKTTKINNREIGDGLTLRASDIEGVATSEDLTKVAEAIPDITGLAPAIHGHTDLDERIKKVEEAVEGGVGGGGDPSNALIFSPDIESVTNLDGYTAVKAYQVTKKMGATSEGWPFAASRGVLLVFNVGGSSYTSQTFYGPDGTIWARGRNGSSSWSAWREIGGAVDLTGYVPTSRMVNDKKLDKDIKLTAADVEAASKGDFDALVEKVNGMGGGGGAVTSVNGETGDVLLDAEKLKVVPADKDGTISGNLTLKNTLSMSALKGTNKTAIFFDGTNLNLGSANSVTLIRAAQMRPFVSDGAGTFSEIYHEQRPPTPEKVGSPSLEVFNALSKQVEELAGAGGGGGGLPPMGKNEIGSYAYLGYGGMGAKVWGETVTASSLFPSNAAGTTSSTGDATGTWRCMGTMGSAAADQKVTLFVKIA